MTQANNRQGTDWTKAPGDGGGRTGPGTESNRARAARGGFVKATTLPLYRAENLAALRYEPVHALFSAEPNPGDNGVWIVFPNGSRERPCVDDLPALQEVRPQGDAGLAVNGVKVADASNWTREECKAMTFSNGPGDVLRAGPSPQWSAPALAQPDPAPGQVWLPRSGDYTPGQLDDDGTLTIESVTGSTVGFAKPAGGYIDPKALTNPAGGWTCIGIATPHGRVMAGDGFRASSGIQVEVTGVGPDDLLVRGSQEPTRERFTPGHAEAATLLGWTRTRYAPARAGERLRWRAGGRPDEVIDAETAGCVADPAQWERLGGGHSATQTLASDLSAHEIIMDWIVSAEGIGHANGGVFTDCGRDGLTAIGLAAPAPQLRALFDAIGRALELPATRHACPFGDGLTVTVLRDEMLFTPTAETGIGTADLAGDARGLVQLRACVQEAMATGAASLPQWGAKGPRVEVRREGGPMVTTPAHEPTEAVRYTPSEGGADAWRWGV